MKILLQHCNDCPYIRLPWVSSKEAFEPVAHDSVRCEGDLCALSHAHS